MGKVAIITLKDIKAFFSTSTRPVTSAEIKALSTEDRGELKALIAAQVYRPYPQA